MIIRKNMAAFSNDLFIKEKDPVNDILELTEASTIFVRSIAERIVNWKISKAFKNFFQSLFMSIIVATILPLLIIFYLILAPTVRILLLRKAKKVSIMKGLIKSRIKSNKYDTKTLIAHHKRTKEFLDKQTKELSKLDGEPIFRYALVKYLNEIKEVESIQRIAAYPEYNEIALSYDELYELNNLTDLSF